MKRSAIAALVVFLITSLTACSPDSNEIRNSEGEVSLTFWHAQSGEAGDLLQRDVDDFNEKYQGEYEVNAIYQGSYSDAFAKLAANIQTGFVPVLMQASDIQSSYLKDSGLALPIEDALGAEETKRLRGKLIPSIENYYIFDGKLWSMPLFVSSPATYVNPDILRDSGVDPHELHTFEDYLEAAEKVHHHTGGPGMSFPSSAWWAEQFTAASDLQYCTPDNGIDQRSVTGLGFMNQKFYDLWKRIQQGYQSGALIDVGPSGEKGAALLTSGRIAIHLNSSGGLANVQKSGIPLEIRSIPLADPQGGMVPGGNSLWILNEGKSAEEVEGATVFAEFMASPEIQARNLPESGYLPSTVEAAKLNSDLPEPQQQVLENMLNNPVNTVTAGCHMGALEQIRGLVGPAVQKVVKGADPKTTFESLKEPVDIIIERYQRRAEATEEHR